MGADGLGTGQAALFWSLSLVTAVLMGFWAAAVGRRNGRSYGACFLLGFLLGIIGVIVVYLLGRASSTGASPGKERPHGEAARHRACSCCGNLVPAEDDWCGYCGAGPGGAPK